MDRRGRVDGVEWIKARNLISALIKIYDIASPKSQWYPQFILIVCTAFYEERKRQRASEVLSISGPNSGRQQIPRISRDGQGELMA